MLVCPRGSCRMVVGDEAQRIAIDSTRVLWVPKGIPHDDEGQSSVYDTFALYPSDSYVDAMLSDNGLALTERIALEREMVILRRTPWLHEILERYFYERLLNPSPPEGCTYFLEKQILNEVGRIVFRSKLESWDRPSDGVDDFDRALRYIESNLFEALDVKAIARAAKISESTLLRLFKAELRQTPSEYVRNRRLDEAMILLKRGEHQVSDVAMLVGYDDVSAFSKAFRKRFDVAPSVVREP
jgi:AraC-like DNA-binding protein